DPPAPKPTQPARKPKTTAPKAPSRPSVSIPVRLAQPAPTSTPAKQQEKKRKQATETSDKPPKAKKSKHGWVADEDGKGKAKVTEEQVAHDLLSLQKHKKTSPVDQYIFQRRVSTPTGSSRHDESPYALLGQLDSEEESEKFMLGAEEGGQDEGQAGPDPDAQAEDQTRSDAGHAGSNPDETSEGQARPDPGDAEAKTKGFTATAYPKVQQNLKLAVEEHVLLEEPASSSGTLSSLQHPSRDFSFGYQFFSDKPSDADKNAETKVESMPPPPPPPTSPFGALEVPGASGSAQVPPSPPPSSSTNQESPSKGSVAPSPSKTTASAEYQAWTTTDIRLRPSISLTPAYLDIDEDMAPDEQAQSSDDEDIGSAHILTVNLRQGCKGRRPALSISKMKAAYYPDAGLEQMVSDQFWIEEECKYDIAAMYGISHWCFQRQRFYIDRHMSEGDRSAIRTHMRILSVVRIEVFSMYGSLEPPPTERQEDSNYGRQAMDQTTGDTTTRRRFQLRIESYQTQLNLTKPQWDATGYEYKHDYTVIDSPRAAIFRDKYGVQMMMCVNEIHKFSDGTLQKIDEALDYRIKEFRINRMNPGLNTRFLTRKDVDRSEAFMFAIQWRLKTRKIFHNLESFVGGLVRERDYRLLKRTE
nr:hypothetical protein [Tanacetum cinerariifolium]